MGDLSRSFNRAEFKCKCGKCEQVGPDPQLIREMQRIRDHFGRAITVNSGHRCEEYNRRVGGAKGSQHLKGTACDFNVKGVSPRVVQNYLLKAYPDRYGIGKYPNFTHFDVRGYKARW